jgi:hypothetical protein
MQSKDYENYNILSTYHQILLLQNIVYDFNRHTVKGINMRIIIYCNLLLFSMGVTTTGNC